MRIRWGYQTMSYIAPLVIASAIGCGGADPSSEGTEQTAEAVSSTGLTASIAINHNSSTTYIATVTVMNSSSEPATNWQVGINLNGATLQQGQNGAEVFTIGGVPVFTPNSNSKMLAAGASTTFSFPTAFTGSFVAPTVASVDGVANGAPGAGMPADGVDRIARAVATGAVNVAEAYENNKLPNTGDANYAQYDGLIWSAQTYIISGNKIAFDTTAPGYAFVPVQAQAQLDAMQDSPTVASYLVTGLSSCFADTSGAVVYNFKAGVLKGFTYPGPSSGTLPGEMPPAGDWTPPGYNPNTVTDSYTSTGAAANGAEQITVNMTSSTDYWFGILTSSAFSTFTSTTQSKYTVNGQHSGNQQNCSPFNGPGGGTSNPALVVTLNGSALGARAQTTGLQCQNGCKSTMVIDPVAYATPGAFYNAAGLVGPQPNPFAFDPTQTAATVDHAAQWATTTDQYGNIVYGSFTSAIVHRGVTTGYGWQQD